MIKNIIIINDFDYIQGGASKVAIQTANILVRSNPKINVYFFSACHDQSCNLDKEIINICTNQGESIKDKNKIRGIINGIYNFKAKRELKKVLKTIDRNETIIHVHGWTKALSSSVFSIAFKMNFKVVLTMHDYFTACPNGGYYNYKKNEICKFNPMCLNCLKCNCDSRNYLFKIYRVIRHFVQNKIVKLNKKLTDVISISDFSEKILRKTLNPKTKIHRLYNPVDFDKNILNENFSNNDYYLSVSRLSPEKGVEDFCIAMTKTGKKGIVVGDGSERKKLEQLYPKIEFVGWKNEKEIKEYMKNAKYLVFTSRLYESSPLTTMEALMMKLPCIVWSGCAAKEQIKENENGFIYDDIDDLCNIILNKKITKFKFEYDYDYLKNLEKIYEDIGGKNE